MNRQFPDADVQGTGPPLVANDSVAAAAAP